MRPFAARAEREVLLGLHAILRPGVQVLDVGSGGVMAAHVRRIQPAATVALADLASGRRLAFTDGAFDVVVCAWGLEVAPNPRLATAELARVLAPGGTLLACFRSTPEGWLGRTSAAVARRVRSRWVPGRALDRAEVPLPALATTRVARFAGGLTTFVHGRAAQGIGSSDGYPTDRSNPSPSGAHRPRRISAP